MCSPGFVAMVALRVPAAAEPKVESRVRCSSAAITPRSTSASAGTPVPTPMAGLIGLTESYDYYDGNSENGSITISYEDGAPGAPLNLAGTVETGGVALTWTAPSANGSSAITDY